MKTTTKLFCPECKTLESVKPYTRLNHKDDNFLPLVCGHIRSVSLPSPVTDTREENSVVRE